MSKKTNAAKLKARTTKLRKNAHKRGRKNPAFGSVLFADDPSTDPILLHHIAGFILRMLELHEPTKAGMGAYPHDTFTMPTGVTPKSEVQ